MYNLARRSLSERFLLPPNSLSSAIIHLYVHHQQRQNLVNYHRITCHNVDSNFIPSFTFSAKTRLFLNSENYFVLTGRHFHNSLSLRDDKNEKSESSLPNETKKESDSSEKITINQTTSSKQSESLARLTFTDRCRSRLKRILDADELLRIGVRGGGCSGFEYEFSIAKRTSVKTVADDDGAEDILIENLVVIDAESIEFMKSAQLDYEDELIRSGFRIVNNVLAEKGCSCGASFSLKF